MTLYDKIMTYSIEDLAAFIYGLIAETEDRLQESLQRQGVEASIVRIAPELQIADNVAMLQQEVPDDT